MNENDKKELFEAIAKKVAEEVKDTVAKAAKTSTENLTKPPSKANNSSSKNFKSLEKKVKSGQDTLAERVEYEKQKVAQAVQQAGKKFADATIKKIPKEVRDIGKEAVNTTTSVAKQTTRLGSTLVKGGINIGTNLGKGAIQVGKQLTNNKLTKDAYSALMYSNPITALLYENSDLFKSGFKATKSAVGLAYNTTKAVSGLAWNATKLAGGIAGTVGSGLGKMAFSGASAIYNNRNKLFGKKDDTAGEFKAPTLFTGDEPDEGKDNNSGKFLLEDKSKKDTPLLEERKSVTGLLEDISKKEKENQTFLLEDKQSKKKAGQPSLKEEQEKKNLMSPIFGMKKELDGIHKQTKEGNVLLKKGMKDGLLALAGIGVMALALKNWDKIWPVMQKGIDATLKVTKSVWEINKAIWNRLVNPTSPEAPNNNTPESKESDANAYNDASSKVKDVNKDSVGNKISGAVGVRNVKSNKVEGIGGVLGQEVITAQGKRGEPYIVKDGGEVVEITRSQQWKGEWDIRFVHKNHKAIGGFIARNVADPQYFVKVGDYVEPYSQVGFIGMSGSIKISDKWSQQELTEYGNKVNEFAANNYETQKDQFTNKFTNKRKKALAKDWKSRANQAELNKWLIENSPSSAIGDWFAGTKNYKTNRPENQKGEDKDNKDKTSQNNVDDISGTPKVSYNINKPTQVLNNPQNSTSVYGGTNNINGVPTGMVANSGGIENNIINNYEVATNTTPNNITLDMGNNSSQIMGLYDPKDIAMAGCDILQPITFG